MIPHPQKISSASPQEPPLARRNCSWAAMALGLSLLSACGGGGGGGSTPSASSGVLLTAGAVTGFGSVVVDGTEIEDAQAKVLRENADGSLSSDLVQLGQRVRVKHDERGQASQITVDAALIGEVSAINSTAGTLRVAAQNVSVNGSSALGPVTVFGGGYADLSNVSAGDLVEIHGTPVYSSSNASYTVQATRIAKAPAGAKLQISGKISGYTSTAGGASFTLNGLTVQVSASSALRPAGSTLADGLQVTAFSNAPLSASTLTASHIRVDRNQDSASVGAKAQLSGVATGYDATANTLVLGSTLVTLAGATVTDLKGKQSPVQNGAYVLVGGSVNSDGSVTAATVKVRTADTTAALAQVLLIGPITDFVDASSFVVRGVPVDATNITWATACPGVSAADEVLVKVQALQQAATNVVQAQSLSCTPTVSTQVIRKQEGTASAADLTAKTFTLTLENNTVRTVQWNEATSFLGLVAPGSTDTVGGKSVYVDGYLSGNTLVARVVRLDDESAQAPKVDGERFRKPRNGPAPQGAWTEYRNKRN